MPEHFGLSNSLLPYIEAIFCGLLEVTNGISMVASLGTSVFTICLASLLLRIWWNIYSNASCKYNLRQRIINKTIFSRKNIACIFFKYIYLYTIDNIILTKNGKTLELQSFQGFRIFT